MANNRKKRVNKRKPKDKKRLILILVAELILICIAGLSAYVVKLYNQMQYQALDKDTYMANYDTNYIELKDENGNVIETIAMDYEKIMEGYRNIAIIGVDARDQEELTSGVNGDVIIIASINNSTGEIKLVSVLRDTLMKLIDGGKTYPDREYDKANSQICYTGISDMIGMLNMNLDMEIQEYVVVNWSSVAKVINTLGGVEIDVKSDEIMNLLNGYLTEVNDSTGIWAPQLKETGLQVLTGTQAVAYCRIRYAGVGDDGRANHQKEVIGKCLDRCQTLVFSQPNIVLKAANQAMDSIATNLKLEEILPLALDVSKYTISDTANFPFNYESGEYLGTIYTDTEGVIDTIVANDFAANVKQLHEYLFGEDAKYFTPSDTVQKISDEIADMAQMSN